MRFAGNISRDQIYLHSSSHCLALHPKSHTLPPVLPSSASPVTELPWLSGERYFRAEAIAKQCVVDIFGASFEDSDGSSIYSILAELLQKCHPTDDDISALSPGPVVDETLNRLVDIIRGKPTGTVGGRLAMAVDRLIVQRIRSSEELQRQASIIREAAGIAEAAMEYHYASRLTRRLERIRAGYYARGLDAILGVFDGFPYIDSYLELVKAEVSILSLPESSTITMGGCGPLPITGILYHALTGAQIELIDHHPKAAAFAKDFICEMERLGILSRNVVRVRCEDVGALLVDHEHVCDVIMVASLVDRATKYQLAQKISCSAQQSMGSPALLLRSAKGLCAELAYVSIDRAEIEQAGMVFQGELVPCNHVISDADESEAQKWGLMSLCSPSLLDVLPAMVLNSSELYSRNHLG
ncbi:MAG: hypothetical protein KTR25_02640 [Myxococcales bacterium]|nr:hypothetical protein [Myxococcales bacterium]